MEISLKEHDISRCKRTNSMGVLYLLVWLDENLTNDPIKK